MGKSTNHLVRSCDNCSVAVCLSGIRLKYFSSIANKDNSNVIESVPRNIGGTLSDNAHENDEFLKLFIITSMR